MTRPDRVIPFPLRPSAPVVVPPYLVGETVAVLLMTDRSTDAVDAEVTSCHRDGTGRRAVELTLTGIRTAFALTPIRATSTADSSRPEPDPASDSDPASTSESAADERTETARPAADPIDEPSPGCNAEPGEPCRWGCLSYVTDPDHN